MLGSSHSSTINLLRLSFLIASSLFPFQGYLSAEYSKLAVDQSSKENPLEENLPETRSTHGISLVTSFWALPVQDHSQATNVEHRKEIEAAMLANLQNHHLRQVVVVLDSVSNETTDCRGFVEYMNRRLDNFTRSSSSSAPEYNTDPKSLPELQCIERQASAGQPNYLEMFQYATLHPSVTSNIVILSNADQVFDDTMSYATRLPNRTIFVLSTNGDQTKQAPPSVRQQYRDMVGDDSKGKETNRCIEMKKLASATKRYSFSWDAYIFHRSLLRESLRSIDDGSELFKRKNFYRKPMPFYMNELGAENAALHDVAQGLVGTQVSVWNACRLIRSWHFHLAPKTHRGNDTNPQWPYYRGRHQGGYVFYEGFRSAVSNYITTMTSFSTHVDAPTFLVPPPFAYVPLCLGTGSCLREYQEPGAFFLGKPLLDASTSFTG